MPSRDGQAPAQLVADLITLAPVLEATGGFEITDALDAQIIALFAERIRPEPRPLADADSQSLAELIARRWRSGWFCAVPHPTRQPRQNDAADRTRRGPEAIVTMGVLLVQADRLFGGDNAVLVIDDTALPKKGNHSVGVAAQYASALGKTGNCQTLVSATLASGEVPVMVGMRLLLPESWASDSVRMARARVPADRQTFRSKAVIAINEVDRVKAAGVHFGCVLADAGHGMSAPFRHALSERGLKWAVGIPRHQKVYRGDVALIFPVAGRGRPRRRHIPDSKSIAAEAMLASASWCSVSWRHGTKGRLSARFAAVRVRVADGPPQHIRDMGGQHMPGDECMVDRRT